MAQYNHQLKRLQPTTNTLDSRKSLPNNKLIRETIQNFSTMKFSRSVKIFIFYLIIDGKGYDILV
jgi:hypothetical protein